MSISAGDHTRNSCSLLWKNYSKRINNHTWWYDKKSYFGFCSQIKIFFNYFDCTPDRSHMEQISITLRFYDVEDMEIKEYFVSFKPVFNSTAKWLYDNISESL